MNDRQPPAFRTIALRTIVVHTVTYFFAGLVAFVLLDYGRRFAEPPLSFFMRPTDDPIVAAGVLFQPLRGLLFGIVFYLIRGSLFPRPHGWLVGWAVLAILGIFSTFGPSPGSLEGLVYTTIPWKIQFGGLIEILTQSLLLSAVTVYWVEHPRNRWLNWTLPILFLLVLLLPTLGLLAGRSAGPS